jgi:hypothetical protein
MKGLGKDFNVIAVASGIQIALTDALGVTFVVYENGGATAVNLTTDSGILEIINDFYANDGVGGVYTHETDDANGALSDNDGIVKEDDEPHDCAVIYVDAKDLPEGDTWVCCTVDGGNVTAIVHALVVQRKPENLPALAV